MSLNFYAAIIPPFHKMLQNVDALLLKAEAHCKASGIHPDELIHARLAPDMLPFAYQIKSTVVHSVGAIESLKKGTFSPDITVSPPTFDALRRTIREGQSALMATSTTEFDSLLGRPINFRVKAYQAEFTAETFLLTFSVPNFYFHVTTAYDIPRANGVNIGKVDYLGPLPLRKITS